MMAYNHRKAEIEWLNWKEKEEKQLRGMGVVEDTIQRLHTYDWQQFKAERNFYEWQSDMSDTLEWAPQPDTYELRNAEDLLNSIENEEMLAILEKVDKFTLEILVLRIRGHSSKEIARLTGIPELAINNRIARLRKKLKKIF